ncbi:MAG: leucine-rich repeat protein [Clostridiales bacterium]|nr:leucine-rich repeat protein [Clostridiales bacterium]
MKKISSVFLALALFLSTFSVLSITSYADSTSGYYKYRYNSSTKEATITGYTGNEENIVIPETLGGYKVTAIQSSAFGYSATAGYEYNVKSITISRYIKEIGSCNFGCGGDFFVNEARPYAPFYVDSNNSYFSAVDGVLFNYNKTELVRCPIGKTGNYTIPSTVTSIRDYAFSECFSLTGVTIPDGVTEIKAYTFDSADSLKTIIIPASVTDIGEYALAGSDGLVIQTSCNSWAYHYALENGYKYKIISGHTFDQNNTCTACGLWKGESQTLKLAGISNVAKGVQIKWNKIIGADGYLIYRKIPDGLWSKIATVKSGTTVSYTDGSVESGNDFIYTVKAYKGNKYSKYDSKGLAIEYLSVPDISCKSNAVGYKTGVYNSLRGIHISWEHIFPASGYLIYRKTGSESYKKIATVKPKEDWYGYGYYIDKTAKTGTKYTYAVRAYNGNYKSAYQEKSITARRFSIKLSATSYVYDGKVKTPKVTVVDTEGKAVSSSYYTVKYPSGRKSIDNYYVEVVFNGKGGFLSSSEFSRYTIKPKAPSLTVGSPKKKAISVKWGSSTGATYYQLQVSKTSDFSSLILNKSNLKGGKSAIISSNISSGTKYYIRIRAVKKTDNGNICSSWTTKSIKAR